LENYGNSCYISTFLQVLFLTDAFLQDVFTYELQLTKDTPIAREDFEIGTKVLVELKKLWARLLLTNQPHISLEKVVMALPQGQFPLAEQQDAAETMRFLLDKMGGVEQGIASKVFGGKTRTSTRCHVCGNMASKEELFTDLQLPLLHVQGENIQMLLNQLFTVEAIAPGEWTCSKCNAKEGANKQTEVLIPPTHLILNILRMGFDMQSMQPTKDTTFVQILPQVELAGYQYELCASIVHQGDTATSGHYFMVGRRTESVKRSWFSFDDSQLKPATMQEAQGATPSDSPYILLYRCVQAPPSEKPRVPVEIYREAQSYG
jgi:ubiquitin carboxyl-terminal hydrolase 35/38